MPRKADPNTYINIPCKLCGVDFKTSRKSPKIYCSKKCSCNDPEIKEKNRQGVTKASIEKYGSKEAWGLAKTTQLKECLKEKYGVEYYSQLKDEWRNKVRSTLKDRYGDENFSNTEKFRKTCIERFGVDNPLKCESIKNRVMGTKMYNHYEYLIDVSKDLNIEMLFTHDEYKGNNYENKYKFKCLKCNTVFQSDVYLLKHINCEVCNPTSNSESEDGVYNYVKELLPDLVVLRCDRTILNGYELDIYIPDKKIAIEFNGLYWHSEHKGKIKSHYHLNKTVNCLNQGIRLFHIYENEWKHKKDIVKSILKNVLDRQTHNMIYGRCCEVKPLTHKDVHGFLMDNHLQGSDKAPIGYGLYYNNELMSVMTFMKSRFDKSYEWELSRYSVKSNCNIVGGAARLLSAFKREFNPRSIVTYSDMRYFYGDVYSRIGFNFVKNTKPNYYYISKDYKILYNRMNFQKKKLPKLLEKFDINMTEWENMIANGYDRIWDCGVSKWEWRNI